MELTKEVIPAKELNSLKNELTRFMMMYKFALDELYTKIDILKQEFQYVHEYNPIEHVKYRLKTPESILKKVYRKGYELSLTSVRENIYDIAGIRISCAFISDIYKLKDMLKNQEAITVVECRDYIKNPKPNGYQSLHLIVHIPIYMSNSVENVCAEIQIRTIAMDFWASLEHKIFYKFNEAVPQNLLQELKDAADAVSALDRRMENIHKEIYRHTKTLDPSDNSQELLINNERLHLPFDFITQHLKMTR